MPKNSFFKIKVFAVAAIFLLLPISPVSADDFEAEMRRLEAELRQIEVEQIETRRFETEMRRVEEEIRRLETPQQERRELFIPQEGLVLRGVNFRLGSAELLPKSFAVLDEVVRSLRENSNIRVEIQGHTSAEGVRSARRIQNNLRLSQERANTVMRHFVQQGISANRLTARGMGEEFPIASNDTQAGRELNRRVVLIEIR
jgi:outer membrane protein OmpA-like peptidoglycan-associated protein